MNKFLIVTFSFFLFGCSGLTNDCGEIYSKYIKDAEYFLVVNLSNQRPYNNGETMIALVEKYSQMLWCLNLFMIQKNWR